MILGTEPDQLIQNIHLLMRSPFMIDAQMRRMANTRQCLVPAAQKATVTQALPLLKKGDRGEAVKQLQGILNQLGADPVLPQTGNFLDMTWMAVTRFQAAQGLNPVDGVVGPKTWAALESRLGKSIIIKYEKPVQDVNASDFPPKPDFPVLTHSNRVALFGSFSFELTGDDVWIKITDNWEKNNIVQVSVPQLVGVEGPLSSGKARVHHLIKDQFVGLWQAWEDEGLLGHVLSCAGALAKRYQRGVKIPPGGDASLLSSHAWGIAFDINAAWNGLGKKPPAVGEKGSVRELVATAHKFGFYWGGHFGDRRADGMHFEAAKIVAVN